MSVSCSEGLSGGEIIRVELRIEWSSHSCSDHSRTTDSFTLVIPNEDHFVVRDCWSAEQHTDEVLLSAR